jgi:hypothetical protein
MTPAELLFQVHIGLQTSQKVVRYENGHAFVISVDSPGKLFKMVHDPESKTGYPLFVTQNMRKISRNTDWVNRSPEDRAITWMINSDGYGGMCKTWTDFSKNSQRVEIEMFDTSSVFVT